MLQMFIFNYILILYLFKLHVIIPSLFIVLEEVMYHFTCPMLENATERLDISWGPYHTEPWPL